MSGTISSGLVALKSEIGDMVLAEHGYPSPVAADHVLAHFLGQGAPGGHFTGRLLDTFAWADSENRLRLSIVYPALGAAMDLYKGVPRQALGIPDGIELLKVIAERRWQLAP